MNAAQAHSRSGVGVRMVRAIASASRRRASDGSRNQAVTVAIASASGWRTRSYTPRAAHSTAS
ncbi:hypothetical protein NHF48_009130 [Sphingomonas sp. H160509]|uniref:hypothetical protein n=1 Tax=Sphingomonas sp. H160509 TaxID=2955313 RepID=UPI00209772FF|nr:hypothetical protein [Sphingomonas sp. H160509]MDD1451093.1 hypothetical protein [Sphingomonas sp. H160509]